MPAEWEPHAATWLTWPHNPETWPGKSERIPDVWADLVSLLVGSERVCVAVPGEDSHPTIEALLAQRGVPLSAVSLHTIESNDCWMRDHGPIFLVGVDKQRPLKALDFRFNAWGGKYPPWEADDRIAKQVADLSGAEAVSFPHVLEGGSIEVDGEGTVLTTESCLLHPNRNPGESRSSIEELLKATLGCKKVLWLGEGIVGDDTDGHIDDLARFVGPAKVVTVIEEDPSDDNFHLLQDNLDRLRSMTDAANRSLEVVTLPMPEPLYNDGQRLPASYANFYIGNDIVVVPTFDDPSDQVAIETLSALFPRRRVVGSSAVDLVAGLGAFHCITQQQPQA